MATTLPSAKVLYNLGSLSRIPPGEGRTFQIEDRAIAVFRTRGGQVFATQAHCPHRGGPLADGLVGADTVICPLHALRFNLAHGHPETPHMACNKLATYEVTLTAAGEVLLHIS